MTVTARTDMWTIKLPNYTSIAGLLSDLEIFRSTVSFRAPKIINNAELSKAIYIFVQQISYAQKILKFYLLQPVGSPSQKRLPQDSVISAFEAMLATWSRIPLSPDTNFIRGHLVSRYVDSIRALLTDPSAILAARKDMPHMLAEMTEDTLH